MSTVIVNKDYRGRRIAYSLYTELFTQARKENLPVVTRTWSRNSNHIHILEQLDFDCVRRIDNDRGEGIATVYYAKKFDVERASFLVKLKSFKLLGPSIACASLLLLAIAAVALYLTIGQATDLSALLLAFATSVLVSSIVLFFDILMRFHTARDEQYLCDMESFGIERLVYNKQELLLDKITESKYRIWISGYRHILSSSIAQSLWQAANKGVQFHMLISSPWKEGFKAAYGSDSSVIKNYIGIIHAIIGDGKGEPPKIRFTSEVLFSDVYLIDECFVTSPYSHERVQDKKITARDFFTLVVPHESRLYQSTKNEFEDLWNQAEERLNVETFVATFPKGLSSLPPNDEEAEARFRTCIEIVDSELSSHGAKTDSLAIG